MNLNVWDNSRPVEKSSYVKDDGVSFFNLDAFHAEPGKLKMLDLFCGAGGFAVGCAWAGFQSVLGVDHFEPAIKTWVSNHPNAIGCLGDIARLDPVRIKKLLQERGVDKIDLITGGVPCQGFSIANRKHNDNDSRNFLFKEYMRFVKVFSPSYIILENVSGMRSTAGGRFEQEIKKQMERLGYTVSVDLVNAADFGVPQLRYRLFFVGVKRNRGLTIPYAFPEGDFKGRHRTVDDAFSDLPELGNDERISVYKTPPQNDYQRLMRGLGEISAIPGTDVLYNHVSPNHPQSTIDMIASTKQGEPMYDKFKQRIKLRPDAPSPTQLAGGIRPQFQFGHPTQPRGLSIRERARIQSFPDSYVFKGGIVQERVQTGNAVPPLLEYNIVRPIARELLKERSSKPMYRVWYSTESFGDFIIDNTDLSRLNGVVKSRLYESDAGKPRKFHTMPDHIRKILYLDACDLIVEKDNEPIFSIEVTTEAGTGHNAFQRFARIAASVENNVPAFYIYPEGAIIKRKGASARWDKINPLIFRALESVMSIYRIPALLYYFPSDIDEFGEDPNSSPNLALKGLRYDADIVKYSGCPDSSDQSMKDLFAAINEVLRLTGEHGARAAADKLLANKVIRDRRNFMQGEFTKKADGRSESDMSPLTAVTRISTEYLLNYLSKFENKDYRIGELLRGREYTSIYQVNAGFRGDPYPGALAAIDYLVCREGKTFEDRRDNLVLLFGTLNVDDGERTISVIDRNGSSIQDFFKDVQSAAAHNLLVKDYCELRNFDIPRYLMQVRYGSTYSKAKHIRVFSYFADAVLFPDGSLWRDA